MKRLLAAAFGFAAVAFGSVTVSAGPILDEIKARGKLRCGIYDNVPGLATLDDKGRWQGFDVDYCRAVAAALFGNGEAVDYVKMTFAQGIPGLKSREIDIAALAITFTAGRDGEQGLDFIGPTLYSGHGFMVHKRTGAKKIEDLNGATICVVAGTVTDSLISDYFKARNMTYKAVAFENTNQRYEYYENGRCDVVTSEIPFLGTRRLRLKNPDEHVILAETFEKSHMGPTLIDSDPQWSNVARMVHYALINAEEYGVCEDTIAGKMDSKDPAVQRFLGKSDDAIGPKMGLAKDFTINIVKAVGCYADIWERNFGMKSAVKLPRGMNALPQNGGLQWSPNWR